MIRRIVLSTFLVNHFLSISADAVPPAASVPQTGQATCCEATGAGVDIDRTGTGKYRETLSGVPLPDPRFTDNGDQTMTDRLTGLAWTRDANPSGEYKSWRQALDYIKTLNRRNHLGHSDWRLPSIGEMESLVNIHQGDLASWLRAQGYVNVPKDDYWTSSTYAAYTRCAWSVGMYSGITAGRGKEDGGYVWPVRTGQPGVFPLRKTGQIACYDDSGTVIDCAGTGQDGELQSGAAWPVPRFTENADRTVTDRLTGLAWSREGKGPGPTVCNPGIRRDWRGALDHVTCLNANGYLGRSDWRLPNRDELASMVNHGRPDSAAWLNTQGFSGVQAGSYWSSSACITAPWNAWGVNMHDGAVTSSPMKREIDVWPVRGGR